MPLPVIGSILDLGTKLIDKLIPDPKQKAEALQKLQELQQSGDLTAMSQQVEINKIEASSGNKFAANWRPLVGYICAAGLAMQLVLGPLVQWGSTAIGHPVQAPKVETELLSTVLIGMLGLGGLRTIERLNGKANGQ